MSKEEYITYINRMLNEIEDTEILKFVFSITQRLYLKEGVKA